jgi:glycosyltransferase involved in cell wall biosynthesis
VVIPCFNVVNEVLKVINKIDLKAIEKVFIIDDCCPQQTGKFLKKKFKNRSINKKINITILKKNIGVGGATIIGFTKALAFGYDIIIKIDADGQHDPRDIKKFLKPLLSPNINFCKGTHFIKTSERKKILKLRYFGNIVLTFLTKFNCKKTNITDAVNSFLGIKSSLLKKLI